MIKCGGVVVFENIKVNDVVFFVYGLNVFWIVWVILDIIKDVDLLLSENWLLWEYDIIKIFDIF